MKEFYLEAERVETSFTMRGDMRDAKATPTGLSKYKLTRSLACRENPVNTVWEIHRTSGFLAVGTSRKGFKAR
ncbi:MAG: hypothetical protein J0J15_09115 [Mesorhizobium sp.]|nr:hypothetical protein [Mesorhizobium sp.]